MPRELRPLVRALGLRRAELAGRTVWRGPGVVAASVGVGPRSARQAAIRLLDSSAVAAVLVLGVAGACDPGLRVADVVNPEKVVDAADGSVYEPRALPPPAGHPPRCGTLVTVDRIGAPVPPGTTAVDMETAAVAAECAARGVPWDVRRSVSDIPGGLPATVATLLRADGQVDLVAVMRLVARSPGQLRSLVAMGRDTSRAVAAVTAEATALLVATW